jgi:alkanesulfonate monooxygenase SsuD/methylene tetrahydromethanopterin reductase-like flavin-dependent oxidoreductase (luciferase family)
MASPTLKSIKALCALLHPPFINARPQREGNMFRVGVIVRNSWPIRASVEYAQRAEEFGFSSVWANSLPLARDPFLTLGAIAQNTKRIRLGTAVVDVRSRHPAVLAASIASLYELSGGRADLGVSPGGGGRGRITFGRAGIELMDPVGITRESVTIIKSLLSGETVNFQGKHFKLNSAVLQAQPNRDIKVLVAAESPRMLKLAGEVADGLIAPKGPNQFSEGILQQFLGSVRDSGRKRWQVETVMECNVAVADTTEEAVELLRPYVAESISHFTPPALKTLNLTEETVDNFKADPSKLPADLVKQFSVCGTAEECTNQLRELKRMGLDELYLWYPEFTPSSKYSVDKVKEREYLMERVGKELIPMTKSI